MFICNFKINGKKIWKVTLVILIILISILMIFALTKIFKASNKSIKSNALNITSESYTTFLKDCHENIDDYIGKTFTITGYIYRLPDFNTNQFVLARTMILDEKNQSVVVGILSQCSSAEKYSSGSWVTVTGCITKGNYNGEIPILDIIDISSTKVPESEFVYLPE